MVWLVFSQGNLILGQPLGPVLQLYCGSTLLLESMCGHYVDIMCGQYVDISTPRLPLSISAPFIGQKHKTELF